MKVKKFYIMETAWVDCVARSYGIRKLAKKMKCTPSIISMYLSGKAFVPEKVFEKMKRILVKHENLI